MNEGVLYLSSEPVNLDSFNTTLIVLHNNPNGESSYGLGQSDVAYTSDLKVAIQVTISCEDLLNFKYNKFLAEDANTSFVSLPQSTAGNKLEEVPSDSPVQVLRYDPDISSPRLLNYTQ